MVQEKCSVGMKDIQNSFKETSLDYVFLCNTQGCARSRAYPGNTGNELGTHTHTHWLGHQSIRGHQIRSFTHSCATKGNLGSKDNEQRWEADFHLKGHAHRSLTWSSLGKPGGRCEYRLNVTSGHWWTHLQLSVGRTPREPGGNSQGHGEHVKLTKKKKNISACLMIQKSIVCHFNKRSFVCMTYLPH